MPASVKQISCCLLSFSWVLTCAIRSANGQSRLDDVHIATREAAIAVANPEYVASTGFGPYSPAALIKKSVDLVLVPVTITDALSRAVVGLGQDNFQLFEGKKSQEIKNFSSEDTPVSLGIILDVSGSMGDKIDRAREAVVQFCEAANQQDEFFLITFSDSPQLASDFDASPEQLENELLYARPSGRTALLDAIYMGIMKMRNAKYGRKSLLIISDGGDNHSHYTEHEVKSALKEADVMLFSAGTYDRTVSTEEERLGPELLRGLAELTGGQAFTLTNPKDLPLVTHSIGTQLRHQYVLAYQPEAVSHDGKWHKISVKLKLPRGLPFFHVAARTGYYAATN
jgi:Ca-activated chloride channel homolog